MDTSNKTNKIFILSATVLMFTASLGVFSFISYQRVAENKNSTITFSGEGTVSSTPNIAEFTFNISAERDELKQAREEVTKKVDETVPSPLNVIVLFLFSATLWYEIKEKTPSDAVNIKTVADNINILFVLFDVSICIIV